MSTQGWMIQAASFSCSGRPGPPFKSVSQGTMLHSGDQDGSPECSENRLELLNRIKNRIKSGFYNSDAVIDDIGHGFAQALDQAL